MTDQLSTLLRDEADQIAVPAAPAPAVLRKGRSLRRRHRVVQGVAAAAVVAVVATAGVTGTRLLGPESGDGGSGDGVAGTPDADGAFAVGSTVYAGATRADVGEPVKVLYYTSAGVLVRSGDEPWTDAPGESRYSLLHEDGTLKRLDLVLGDVMPSTDGNSPHVAYAHRRGEGWEVVVRDVGTDRVVGRAPVDATLDKRGWSAPPVELAGDRVYVATGEGVLELDWRTGRQRRVPGTPAGTLPDVAGGTWLDHTRTQIVVRRLSDGKAVLSVPSKRLDYGMLSPDGSHVLVVDQSDEESESRFTVYRVATGSSRTFRSPWYEQGWTPAGDLLRVHGSTVSTCDADTGRCSKQTVDLPPGGSQELKLAGKTYES